MSSMSRPALALLAGCSVSLALTGPAAGQVHVLFDVHGSQPGQGLGRSVNAAGDVDGDGLPDLIVGGVGNESPTPPSNVLVLSGADGSVIHSWTYEDDTITAVAGLGDLNGDGRSDLVVGQPDHRRFDVRSGASGHILFSGSANNVFFGWSANPAGDVNADGVPDVVVGAGFNGFQDYGGDLLRVYSGADGSVLQELDKYDPTWWPKSIGWSVDGIGDVNGDGFDDVIGGQPLNGQGVPDGVIVIRSGANFSLLHAFGDGGNGYGYSAADAGDVDGDGIHDVVGGTMSWQPYVSIHSGATGALLLKINNMPAIGSPMVDGIGDIDGDGHSDIVVGQTGAVLFYSGNSGQLLMTYKDLEGGVTVAAVDDIDGDGRSEVIVGDQLDDAGGTDAGRVVVLSSTPEPWTNLGLGLAGALGEPALSGAGTLVAGSPGFLRVLGALPSAPGALFVGFSALGAPFKGGTLVPTPNLVLNLTTSPGGSLLLPWSHWPAGLPGFSHIWFQAWIADPTAPAGAAASNALLATTPAG